MEVAGRVVWGGVYRFGEISSEWVTGRCGSHTSGMWRRVIVSVGGWL